MSGERHAPAPPLAPDLSATPAAEESVDVAIDMDGATAPPPAMPKASGTPEPSPVAGARVGADTVRMASETKRSVRPRMTLKIPDDEISRPQLTPSAPPARAVSGDSAPEMPQMAITAMRIISIESPPASPAPPVVAAAAPPPVAFPAPGSGVSPSAPPGPVLSSPIVKAPPRPAAPVSPAAPAASGASGAPAAVAPASVAPAAAPPAPAPGTSSFREDSWTPYQQPVSDARASAIPPAPAPGTMATREDSWTPYQPTVADLHPPVVHKAPSAPFAPLPPVSPKEPAKETSKETPEPAMAPKAAAPAPAPVAAQSAPSAAAAPKRSGDSMDDIPIVTEVAESPDSSEPLDLDEAISSLPPPPPKYATPLPQPAPGLAAPPEKVRAASSPSASSLVAAPVSAMASPSSPAAAAASTGASGSGPHAAIAPSPPAPSVSVSASTAAASAPGSAAGSSGIPAVSPAVSPVSPAVSPVTASTAPVTPQAPAASSASPSPTSKVAPLAAPAGMSGTLPINYIKDLPPMRALAPTEPEGEEVRFDDEEASPAPVRAPRKSDPTEAAEISADDLVSIESVPSLATKQPLPASTSPSRPGARPGSNAPPGSAAAASGASSKAGAPAARAARVIVPSAGTSPLAPPPMSETAPAGRRRARPWWEELFNDDFIRTMAKITDEQISGESDFIEDSLAVAKGAMVLDLACGTGHHAIELTRRGYKVVGFDLSLPMLARAAEEAQERGQKLNFVQGDMREMTFEDTFDGVYCWNTSFGFFEEDRNQQVISRVHKALRKSGQFLLDVINRDYLIRQAPSLAWFEGEGCICMDEMSIDWITSRMRVKRTMMMDDGRTKEIEYSVRVYSLHELGKILHESGFRVAEVSGRASTPGVFFGNESPRTLILAEKR